MDRIKSITIDFKDVEDSKGIHKLLKEKLDFPHFYGNNWDAFWDSITGLVEMPEELILLNTSILKEKLPRDYKSFKSCLEDMEKEYPKWASKTNWS